MGKFPVYGVIFLVLGAAIGWFSAQAVSSPAPGSGEGPDSGDDGEVLAIVGDSELTRGEVEEGQVADFAQLRRQIHDLTSQALERAIQIQLLRLEADARGIEPGALVEEEVDAYIEDPSQEAVSAFYEARQLQGSLEDLRPQIRAHLRNESREARFLLFLEELRDKYDIERLLEPLRTRVATEDSPAKGPEDAPVTIVEFSDFQCPYCRLLQDPLSQVEAEYGDQVRFVFRQFPLSSIHPDADKASEASLCARDQGMFWEMHDAMFQNPNALGVDQLKATAASLGLDSTEFDECLDSDRYTGEVGRDVAAGRAAGVRGTPMIFVNGRALSGLKTFEDIAEIIDEEIARARR